MERKITSCSSLVVDNQLTSDSLAIANYFNNHFASIASKLVDNLPPSLHKFKEYIGTSSADSMYLNPTFLLEVKNILLELKSKSSSGIDEIPSSVLKSTPDNTADDTNIFSTGRNYETIYDCANKQLCNIDHWLIANKLSLNVEKTKHVVFRTPNSKPPSNNLTLLTRNKRINRVTSSKFLGVILHENLSWKPLMDAVLKRLRISLGVVRKISSYLNRSALTMLYHSMFNCHISYCVTTWSFENKTVILNLQRSANKFIRLINGLNFRDSVKQVMVQRHLLSVEQTSEFEIACFMKRYNKNLLPPCFDDFFQTNSINSSAENITRSTRSSSNLYPKFCRINVTKQSMKYKRPLIWNKIPLDIKRLKSYRNFREHIRMHIISLKQK